jgi:hypothetical protein
MRKIWIAVVVVISLAQGDEGADEARARKVRELMELNGFAPSKKILELAPAYGKHFDDETLDAALAFFRSDAGKKYAAADERGREGIRASIAETTCKEYYDTVMAWRTMSDKKKFPENLEQMEAPIRPGEPDFAEVVLDPWGKKYVLRVEAGKPTVLSFGPDGLEGTVDDIAYPKR